MTLLDAFILCVKMDGGGRVRVCFSFSLLVHWGRGGQQRGRVSSTRESLFVSNTLHICTLVTSHSLEQQRYRHFHLHPHSDSYTLIFDFAPLRSLCLFLQSLDQL